MPYADRAVCVVDPAGVININRIYSDNTKHQLKTALKGRKVVMTNTRGVFIQVAWQPEPFIELKAAPLDWGTQPSPLHLPVGITRKGPLWMSIEELDSVLIGGSRRMGKTMILHSWIQALQQGGAVQLVLFDGKANIEFGDYARPDTLAAEDLHAALQSVLHEVSQREKLFRAAHVRNLREYNAQVSAKLKPIVIVIDEIADVLDKHPQAEADPERADRALRRVWRASDLCDPAPGRQHAQRRGAHKSGDTHRAAGAGRRQLAHDPGAGRRREAASQTLCGQPHADALVGPRASNCRRFRSRPRPVREAGVAQPALALSEDERALVEIALSNSTAAFPSPRCIGLAAMPACPLARRRSMIWPNSGNCAAG